MELRSSTKKPELMESDTDTKKSGHVSPEMSGKESDLAEVCNGMLEPRLTKSNMGRELSSLESPETSRDKPIHK